MVQNGNVTFRYIGRRGDKNEQNWRHVIFDGPLAKEFIFNTIMVVDHAMIP